MPASACRTRIHTQERCLPTHLPTLDGLRGLAILLVLGHNLQFLDAPVGPWAKLVSHGLDAGWIGVQLFFVLSGFLITGVLLDARGQPHMLRNFYARRVLRIVPLYAALLVALLYLLPLLTTLPPDFVHDRGHAGWYWSFLSNWAVAFGIAGEALPHLWSVAVEEQFYLLWPLLLWRRSAAGVLRVCLVVALLSLLSRLLVQRVGLSAEAIYHLSFSRMDALALGGAAAALCRMPAWGERLCRHGGRLMIAAAALLIAGAFVTQTWSRLGGPDQGLGYSLLALVFMLMLLSACAADAAAARSWWSGWLRWPLLRVFGVYSYAIYLFHKPWRDLVGKPLLLQHGAWNTSSVLATLAFVGGSAALMLAAGWLSHHAFERHFLALRHRFGTPLAAKRVSPAAPAPRR